MTSFTVCQNVHHKVRELEYTSTSPSVALLVEHSAEVSSTKIPWPEVYLSQHLESLFAESLQ